MIARANPLDQRLLVTGATGFIGHYVLAELLGRGRVCAVLLRPPLHRSVARLAALLAPLGHDLEALVRIGRLRLIEGDLTQSLDAREARGIVGVVHCAGGSTRFEADRFGEPHCTNINGLEHLLTWMTAAGIRDLHLVGSAYQCGITARPAAEDFLDEPHAFRNVYERTKWRGEQLARAWAQRAGAMLTVYRPSIVVGDQANGRATTFTGFYLMARANELLARGYDANDPTRLAIRLRVVGQSDSTQNLVPVDQVAAMIGHAVCDPCWHGKVYHLTHPSPPTNALIKRTIEQHFDIGGGRFVEPQALPPEDMTDAERLWHDASRAVRGYLLDGPRFVRTGGQQLAEAAGVAFPEADAAWITRLIRAAQACQWGKAKPTEAPPLDDPAPDDEPLIAHYFETYLPARVARSRIARMTGLTVTMRFVIRDLPDGQWLCRFVRGRLREVIRGCAPGDERFTYTTTRAVFWRSIAGQTDPQAVFFSDEAAVSGDVEAALKMAMILHRFNRELPCDRATLEKEALCPTH